MAAELTWRRIAAGHYVAEPEGHRFEVVHREIPDDGSGYGRRDDWVVVHWGPDGLGGVDRGYPSDPDATLREAKRHAAEWLGVM